MAIDLGARPDFLPGFIVTAPSLDASWGSNPPVALPSGRGSVTDALEEGRVERVMGKYTHFSVLLNKDRRLAFYVEADYDFSPEPREFAKKSRSYRKDTDRYKADEQMHNKVYKHSPFDNGHLATRHFVHWSDHPDADEAEKEAVTAQADSDYRPNLAPQSFLQHRGGQEWSNLEKVCKDRGATSHRMKCFIGPVLLATDEPLPERFQKDPQVMRRSGEPHWEPQMENGRPSLRKLSSGELILIPRKYWMIQLWVEGTDQAAELKSIGYIMVNYALNTKPHYWDLNPTGRSNPSYLHVNLVTLALEAGIVIPQTILDAEVRPARSRL